MTLYFWNEDTYNSVTELTPENAPGVITMAQDGTNFAAAVQGIAAKAIDETVYVAGSYTSAGVTYNTNVISYSLGAYCKSVAAQHKHVSTTCESICSVKVNRLSANTYILNSAFHRLVNTYKVIKLVAYNGRFSVGVDFKCNT